MHREDNSKYLLYIEPKVSKKSKTPVEDELVKLIETALAKSKSGNASYSNLDDDGSWHDDGGWKGSHMTECGKSSSNKDYLLENGMITNSLAPFYLRWYRNSIPQSDINKLNELGKFYKQWN